MNFLIKAFCCRLKIQTQNINISDKIKLADQMKEPMEAMRMEDTIDAMSTLDPSSAASNV